MSSAFRKRCGGQATLEAAFALPVIMVLVLLVLQPGILLYDRIVMEGAAAEACRLLATAPADQTPICRDYVLRRLSAVPQADIFHVHTSGCTWDVRLTGDEASGAVQAEITTEVQPLPLVGSAAALLGACNEQGNVVVSVSCTRNVQPDWVDMGSGPEGWVGSWV